MTYFYYYGKQYATATPADSVRKLATANVKVFCWEVKDDGKPGGLPCIISGEMITNITEK